MTDCPTQERLEEFVLRGAADEDLYVHIEGCQNCGRIIEELCLSTDPDLIPDDTAASLTTARQTDVEFLQMMADNPPCLATDAPAEGVQFPDPPTIREGLGSVVGYEIVRRIDGGGFGEVFEAFDTQLNRTVALKLLRVAQYDRQSLLRFQHEAKAAGSIQHENVVTLHRVLDPREDFPFACLVMELVKGGSLKNRIESEEPLEIKQIVRWIVQAARGLSAVHAGGLLHRDLKPANLLIDETGRLKLGDFGLARPLVTETEFSVNVAGTPAYMSPEQILTPDRLTVHCDIYGLGVVLYQLLTGVRPFQGKGEGLRQQIIESSPTSIRKLNPRVPGDLETICMRCLHKDPTRRFETAQAFADDLQNWLDSKPITSRPVGRLERGYRWMRRNPTLATIMLSSVVIALGASLAVWKIDDLRRKEVSARELAMTNEKLAVANEKVAVANEKIARQVQDDSLQTLEMLVKQLSDQLGDRTRLVSIYEHFIDRLESMSAAEGVQSSQLATTAEAHLRLAMMYDAIAPWVKSKNVTSQARQHFQLAIELLEPMGEPAVENLVNAYDGLAASCLNQGALDEAEKNFNVVIGLCEPQLKKNPNDPKWLRRISVPYESLAVIEGKRGHATKRLEYMQKCLEIRQHLVEAAPDDMRAKHELAGALILLGDAVRGDNSKQAVSHYVQAVALSEEVVQRDPQNVSFWRTLANGYDRRGLDTEAPDRQSWAYKALHLREKISRADPAARSSLRDLVVSHLGCLKLSTDPAESERLLVLAKESSERWYELDSQDAQAASFVARVAIEYCRWYTEKSQYDAALAHALRAVEIRRQGLEQSPSAASRKSLVVALHSLSDIYFQLDRNTEGLAVLDEQLQILQVMLDANENAKEMQGWVDEIQETKRSKQPSQT